MAEIKPHPWAYFQSAEEANEWLEFDAGEEEIEEFAYAWPDQFGEWRRWREAERDML